jgi:hypothetical protein
MEEYPAQKPGSYMGIVVKEKEDVACCSDRRQVALPARLAPLGHQNLEGGGGVIRHSQAVNGAYHPPRLHRDYDGYLRSFSHLRPHMKKPGRFPAVFRILIPKWCYLKIKTLNPENGIYHTKPQRSLRKAKTLVDSSEHHFGEWY